MKRVRSLAAKKAALAVALATGILTTSTHAGKGYYVACYPRKKTRRLPSWRNPSTTWLAGARGVAVEIRGSSEGVNW